MQRLFCFLLFFVYLASAQGLSCLNAVEVDLDRVSSPYAFAFIIDESTEKGEGFTCQDVVDFVTAARILRITTSDIAYALTINTCDSNADNEWDILTTFNQDCASDRVCWSELVTPSSVEECAEGARGSVIVTYPLGKNQVYFLSIFGTTFYGGTGFGTVVAFLSFAEIVAPINDECQAAIPITPRAYISGTTDGAGPGDSFSDVSSCGEAYGRFTRLSPDVWYSFNTGSSSRAYIYSCGGFATDFVSFFYLSSGGCPTTCMTFSTVQGGGCPSLTGGGNLYYPVLAPNTEYYISVSGYVATLGDFFFFLHLADANSICSAAVEITSLSTSSLSFAFSGSVDAATEDQRCSSNSNAVFFKLNSDRGIYGLTLDACNANFDAVISITTSCFADSCLVEEESGCGGENGARLSNVQLPANTDFYVRVASKFFSLNTTYTLSVTGSYADRNGACASPQVVSSVPYSFSGSTRGAQSVSLCGSTTERAATWFSFNTGDGFSSLTLTATAEFQPVIRILSSCGGPCLPVSGSDTVTLQNVAANQQILIAVTGGEGQYTLSISGTSLQAPVIICPSDIVVTASPSTCRYSGTTGTPSLISLDGSGTRYSKSPKPPYSVGVTNVVYTVTNVNNARFSSSCVQQVTVRRPANSGC